MYLGGKGLSKHCYIIPHIETEFQEYGRVTYKNQISKKLVVNSVEYQLLPRNNFFMFKIKTFLILKEKFQISIIYYTSWVIKKIKIQKKTKSKNISH